MSTSEISDFQVKPNGPLTSQAVARLKAIKDTTGMSYAALGTTVGLSGTFMYNLINKGMNVGTQHVKRMAEAVAELENPTSSNVPKNVGPGAAMLTHVFHLRPSLKVSIDLPTDMTDREAERVALFVRSLPCV